MNHQKKPVIVVVGGGAGGLELVTSLGDRYGEKGLADVVLVDASPIHIWKPHLHEVAAGRMDMHMHRLEYVAQARWHSFEFQLGRMTAIDRERKTIHIEAVPDFDGDPMLPERELHYDYLVIAIGSTVNTFGIPGADAFTMALDSTHDAERFRQKLVAACMRADARAERGEPHQVSIAIIGAGATGVELSAELRHTSKVLRAFGVHSMDPRQDVRITLIEAAERVLPALPLRISASVEGLLRKMGIDVLKSERVSEVSKDGLATASGQFIRADLMVWAAGIKAPNMLAGLGGLESNRINQLVVDDHLTSTRDPDVFAFGDCAACVWLDGEGTIPPRAQAAHQQASYLVKILDMRLFGKGDPGPFKYKDFGSLVSLGKTGATGNLMGGIIGGSMFIEGLVARVMYRSLYQMHQIALHGWIKSSIDALARIIKRSTEPHVKLH
ncbi:NAD(P)/FAD-dependent oxidoreductase [Methyloversatilis sp. XJ19-49]|uniref:NAD(P)/FAD-dependent oxidoreductase n=1 Tax=Methyloversatilis sp. XJ19-49 TaxID=2963429 RepID=UPI00211D145A|nr:NAD(P)/FAD-dependent oxidoreductase [Methyloversatilis sp. XJ19-49]MCQ9379596.1 NAD(P)/FAD-dependent oxidoreductase [Methyloversatilis sp. XJ19-49]